METAIIGLPLAGKTTLFNALTGLAARTSSHAGSSREANVALVDVPDERVERLSLLFKPEKTTFASIQFRDLQVELTGDGGMSAASIGELRNADAVTLVIRAFVDEGIPHPQGSLDSLRDFRRLMDTLVFSDLMVAERRMERLAKEGKRGDREHARLEKLAERLGRGMPIGVDELSGDDRRLFSGFAFLTAKPIIVVANTGETSCDTGPLEAAAAQLRLSFFHIQGAAEMEIAQLPVEEQTEFLAALGADEPARARFVRTIYQALGLISFLTVGEDEVRAWSVPRDAPAARAAGRIHTDLERGFIRAEVVYWTDLVEAGGLKEARSAGRLRLEGRDYTVKDGDVLNIRANA
jgi:GTP-binding protein YchF